MKKKTSINSVIKNTKFKNKLELKVYGLPGREIKNPICITVEKKPISEFTESQIELMEFAMKDMANPTTKSGLMTLRKTSLAKFPDLVNQIFESDFKESFN